MEHTIYDSEEDAEGFRFSDEQHNLDVEMDGGYGSMIVIADLGLWNVRRKGYRMMMGRTVCQALSAFCGDRIRLYYDSETDDLKGVDVHHDGVNYYTFREVRTDRDITALQSLIFYGKATQRDVNRYTKPLGKYVRGVYGWSKAKKKAA